MCVLMCGARLVSIPVCQVHEDCCMFVSLLSWVCRPVAGVVNLCPRLAAEQDIGYIVLVLSHELTHALVCVCVCVRLCVYVHVCVCVCLCMCVCVCLSVYLCDW